MSERYEKRKKARNTFVLAHDYLLSILHYDPDTGAWTWLRRIGDDRETRRWNTRYAGKTAGSISSEGYRIIVIDPTSFREHRLAVFYITGEWPEDQIDHRNLNKVENKFENLRDATPRQNSRNRPLRSDNLCGFKGVTQDPRRSHKYQARINIGGKSISLGYWDSPEVAHKRYCAAAQKYFGEFARIK